MTAAGSSSLLRGGQGGAGGAGVAVQSGGTLEIEAGVTGGDGGAGGSATISSPTNVNVSSPFNDAGGDGGAGLLLQSAATAHIKAQVTGGHGGAGGLALMPVTGSSNSPHGGAGGAGGAGVAAQSGGTLEIYAGAGVIGGDGGAGGSVSGPVSGFGGGAFGGAGGAGGAGVFAQSGATLQIDAGAQVTGGNGGAGGSASSAATSALVLAGRGGAGGAAIVINGGGTVTVNGTVTGGNGGAGGTGGFNSNDVGLGGEGITGDGITVINNGSINGGLSGDNATRANAVMFTGGTNVYEMWAGTSVTGNVVNDTSAGSATFRLGGTSNGSFDMSTLDNASIYQGFASFEKTGSSVWTLTGTSTYANDVVINGGTLAVNGSIVSASSTIVNASGVLAGTGTAGAVQVNAGGAFAPGSGTPGSSMTVSSLAFQSGAQYIVALNPSTASFANVTGNAALGGATVAANFATASGYVVKQYTILNAGSISGTFNSTVANANLPSGFKTSLSYDPTNTKVFLDLALDILPPSGPSGPAQNGASGNQSNVGNAIINFFNTNGSIPMAFGALTPNGLTQISGEVGGSSQHTNFQASTQFMNVMSDPTAAGRGSAGGSGAGGAAGYADEAMAYAGKTKSNNPRDAFASFTKAPPGASLMDPRWSVWAMGFGGSQTTDGNVTAGTNTASSSIYGAAVGADYRFSPDTVAGFALAGGGTNFSVVGGGSGRSDLFQAGAFVRQNFGATYLTASAAYGWQDVTTDRYLTVAGVDHLRAEFNTNSYSGRLELGHRFLSPWFGGLGVSRYAAVQATAFELPAYTERAISGANTFALSYGANTSTATRSELAFAPTNLSRSMVRCSHCAAVRRGRMTSTRTVRSRRPSRRCPVHRSW